MFYDTDNIKIHNENCLDTMESMAENSVDSIITDPPYGLGKEPDALEMLKAWVDGETKQVNGSGFMGKKWDAFVPQPEIWKAAFRVLKPGGYLLSFFGTRTFDWGVMAIRLGGFEIRESIAWLHSQGFPKNRDIGKAIDKEAGADREIIGSDTKARSASGKSALPTMGAKVEYHTWDITAPSTKEAKQWHGWGTALKPAMELIVVARKPLSEKTVAKNVLKWGTGAVNIEECRVETDENDPNIRVNEVNDTYFKPDAFLGCMKGTGQNHGPKQGRWPSNVILDGSEEVRRGFPDRDGELHNKKTTGNSHFVPGIEKSKRGYSFKDTGSASRFFYNAKCSKLDREEGLGVLTNTHCTVKPTNLMKYLCTLTTQPGGVIYDPFMGSGSTGKAALLEKFKFIGSEISTGDCEIAKARIIWASKQLKQMTLFQDLAN